MRKQALVIGLGQFGMSVARELTRLGVEVLAVDTSEERVRSAAAFASEALQLDATTSEALARLAPELRDVCLCAIGDESREDSIICTAQLRQMGAKRLIARANDDVHARILKLVGAHQVVNPESAFGERMATQIVHESIQGELALGDGMLISEVRVPEDFVGKTLMELKLPRHFGVVVVALRRGASRSVELPKPDLVIEAEDVLVVVSREDAVARMLERKS